MIRNAEVDAQLHRILQSSAFVGSARSRQFLAFCVNRTLRGQSEQLKETTIAVELFLRATDYDPKRDPIVRVHARRVREKLEFYYRTTGTDDPIKIDIPKGRYVPQILRSLPRRKADFSDWGEPASTHGLGEVGASPAGIGHRARDEALAPRRENWIVSGAILLGVALLGLGVDLLRRETPTASLTLGAMTPIDSLPDKVMDPSWSPDGARLVFTGIEPGDMHPHVYLKDVRVGGSSIRLTAGEATEVRPVWSPDGREIAFIRYIDVSHFEIIRFNLATKTELSLRRFVTYWRVPEDHPALDWSPDGKFLLSSEQTAPGIPMRIVLISLATGERTFLTSPPIGSSGDFDAKFSPDGQQVAFRRGGLGDLYVVAFQGEDVQPAVRLTFDDKGVRGIAWIDHGKSILYGTQRGPTVPFALWKIPVSGGTPQAVSPKDFDAVNPSVSSTGALVLEHRQTVSNLVAYSIDANSSERPLLRSEAIDASPLYSPDGSYVAFTSTRTGWGELWLYRPSEPEPIQLTHFEGEGVIFLPSWSPDSTSIVFSLRRNGATNIVVYNIARGTLKEITSTRNRDCCPVYSSDGEFIYFSSNDDGAPRVWRIRADGSGRAEPLFLEAVAGFQLSQDGKWFYFTQNGESLTVSRRSLLDGSTEEIFHVSGRASFVNGLAIANRRVYIAVSSDDISKSDVFEVNPDTKTYRVVAHLKDLPPFSLSGVPGFSVSSDGRKLIAERGMRDESTFYATEFLHSP